MESFKGEMQMSELRAKCLTPDGLCTIYLKSDVDKGIAEKDTEIRRLKHAL